MGARAISSIWIARTASTIRYLYRATKETLTRETWLAYTQPVITTHF